MFARVLDPGPSLGSRNGQDFNGPVLCGDQGESEERMRHRSHTAGMLKMYGDGRRGGLRNWEALRNSHAFQGKLVA